jgi:hypothetical protein
LPRFAKCEAKAKVRHQNRIVPARRWSGIVVVTGIDHKILMAQDYDVALKLLFRSKSSQAVREIAGGPVKRWLDKELPAIRNTRADLFGETIGGEFVHLEFMSENQTLFELRMVGYYAEIYQALGRHPRQVLVYVGRAKLRMRGYFRSQEPHAQFPIPGSGHS